LQWLEPDMLKSGSPLYPALRSAGDGITAIISHWLSERFREFALHLEVLRVSYRAQEHAHWVYLNLRVALGYPRYSVESSSLQLVELTTSMSFEQVMQVPVPVTEREYPPILTPIHRPPLYISRLP